MMTSTVYVAKSVYGGDGLGRLGDGRVVFVPGAFAGESVRAEIVEEKRRYVKARLVEVVEPSASRVGTGEPPLPGMVYANLDYAAEIEVKERQLADFLERVRIPAPAPHNLRPFAKGFDPLHYRNKAVYHFQKQGGKWAIGYRREPEHSIQEVTEDVLVRPEINAKLPEIRRGVMTLLTQGPESVRRNVGQKGNVTIRWTERSGVRWWLGDAPKDVVMKETTLGKVFEVPADGFYQVNPDAASILVKGVVSRFAASGADELLDLYCGVGTFGLCCAPKRLFGVESGRQAIDFARRNAAAQGVEATFRAARVVEVLRRLKAGPNTAVIVDPPRDGLEPRVPEWLAKCGARCVFYVSCDPATLVRDLSALCRGGYRVSSVDWIDMFPRTARFETFVTLERRA